MMGTLANALEWLKSANKSIDNSLLDAANYDPAYTYGSILPFRVNKKTKEKEFAAPGLLKDAIRAMTAPNRAYQGLLDYNSPEAIQESMNLAGLLQLGGAGLLAAKSPKKLAQPGTLGATVYHGSPHKFDKFDDQLPRILEVNGQPTGLLSYADEAAQKGGGLLGKVDNAGMADGMVKQGGKAADALPLGKNLSDDEVFRKMWDALDNAGDGYIGVRGDNFPVKTKFRKSWNRPDGERTTRLPGTSVIGLGMDNITEESLRKAIKSARGYGENLYLIEGDAPHSIQHLANDPGERLVTDHKILWSTLFD